MRAAAPALRPGVAPSPGLRRVCDEALAIAPEQARNFFETRFTPRLVRADAPADAGPIGAEGLRLTPLRSLAADRAIWPYGAPVWIDALVPWESDQPPALRRLFVTQDTGSAILGPARADLFHGSGSLAGERAGATRHRGRFVVLWPQGETPPGREPPAPAPSPEGAR